MKLLAEVCLFKTGVKDYFKGKCTGDKRSNEVVGNNDFSEVWCKPYQARVDGFYAVVR